MSDKPNHFVLSGGRFIYPSLADRNEDPEFGTGKFEVGYLIPKDAFKADPEIKRLKLAILAQAKEHLTVTKAKKKIKITKLSQFKHPFRDGDEIADERGYEYMRDHYFMTPKTDFDDFPIIGPDKERLDSKDIAKIKGGDYGNIIVNPYFYSQQKGGITLGLQLVQFWKKGESFGRDDEGLIGCMEELEVEEEELSADDLDSEDVEDELDEEDEELVYGDNEEEEEEEAPKKRKPRKAAAKKTTRKTKAKKKTTAKKPRKKKVVEEEEEDDEEDDDDGVDLDDL